MNSETEEVRVPIIPSSTQAADRTELSGGRKRRLTGRSRHRAVWEEPPSTIGFIGKVVVLVTIVLVVLYPLYTVVLTSFSTPESVTRSGGLVTVPGELTVSAYEQIFSGGVVPPSILVSVFVTGVGTFLSLTVSVLAAYGLSRTNSVAHRPILFIFLFTMFFGAGIIPTYLLISGLGLINSLWALILPGLVSAFNILLLRNFFMGIDQPIIDAARVDGAGDWRILWNIVLPMSKAVLAVIALFTGVGFWNSFFTAMLYINDNKLWPLQLVLRSYVLQGTQLPGVAPPPGITGEVSGLPIKMAIVVIAVIPILIVYPFVQRHFTKGVIFGAIKG